MNWNGTIQAGSALAIYVALIGAFLAGFSPVQFALYAALLLGLWLTYYSIAFTKHASNQSAQHLDLMVPSLSESMAELHTLQREIGILQAQFSLQTTTRPIKPDDYTD